MFNYHSGKLINNHYKFKQYIGIALFPEREYSIYFQAVAQLLSAAMIIHAYSVRPTSVSTLLLQPWFAILVSAGAIERLCGVALGVSNERDWVVLVL